jgi:hypothetical protein
MPTPLYVRIAVWLWLVAALVVGHREVLDRLSMPAALGLLFALSGVVLTACLKVRPLRLWIDGLDLRALVFLHVTRFVGIYFLLLHARGELPYALAVPGGWGAIVVATGALAVALVPMRDSARRHAVAIWNTVGVVDIASVVATAAQLGLRDPTQVRALTVLPLSLLPTFLVPLIIATHVVIFVRLARAAPRPLA